MDVPLETLLDKVRERGDCVTRQAAARATQSVLEILGAHLEDADRLDLAGLLPYPCGRILVVLPPVARPLTPDRFVDAVAEREGTDAVAARRTVTAVLGAIAGSVDDALVRRILARLPPGHSDFFGRMEPA